MQHVCLFVCLLPFIRSSITISLFSQSRVFKPFACGIHEQENSPERKKQNKSISGESPEKTLIGLRNNHNHINV